MRLPPAEIENDGPNLTPVIDVVFLLLIFFLVATRFHEEEKLVSIRLAEILQAKPVAMGVNEVIVNIDYSGKFVVMQETLSERQLVEFLYTANAKNPGTKVQIRADLDVKFHYPMTVIGICIKTGMEYSFTVLEKAGKGVAAAGG